MRAVSNTSPILNLAIIGRFGLLREQLGEVWIPVAVAEELRSEEELPGSEAIREAMRAGWLLTEPVIDRVRVAVLERELDHGEAEAIALALQEPTDWLLLDEREARRIAKTLNLTVTGVLGILLKARLQGQLSSMQSVMDDLRSLAGFRIGADLYSALLLAAGEVA